MPKWRLVVESNLSLETGSGNIAKCSNVLQDKTIQLKWKEQSWSNYDLAEFILVARL